MSIVVEDGSQVSGSNSYLTRADYIAYAASMGITIPDSVVSDQQLIKAAIYIATKENSLKGTLVDRDQSMVYPRTNLYINGFSWLSTEIPTTVKNCQMELALDINSGVDLYNLPKSDSTGVKKEKIDGAVEVEYAIEAEQVSSRRSASKNYLSQLMFGGGLSIPIVMS